MMMNSLILLKAVRSHNFNARKENWKYIRLMNGATENGAQKRIVENQIRVQLSGCWNIDNLMIVVQADKQVKFGSWFSKIF